MPKNDYWNHLIFLPQLNFTSHVRYCTHKHSEQKQQQQLIKVKMTVQAMQKTVKTKKNALCKDQCLSQLIQLL